MRPQVQPEPEPEPELSEGVPPRTVLAWLQSVKLEACHEALSDLGYGEDLEMLEEGDEEEVADILAAIEAIEGIKKPTVKKFTRELKKLRGD